jgi:hypothetical protein
VWDGKATHTLLPPACDSSKSDPNCIKAAKERTNSPVRESSQDVTDTLEGHHLPWLIFKSRPSVKQQ